MEPIVAVMLLLGCDDAMMVCRQAAEPVRQYTSMQVCDNDIALQLRFNQDYPTVVAHCVAVDDEGRGQDVTIDWQFDRAGRLFAEARIHDGGVMLASAQ